MNPAIRCVRQEEIAQAGVGGLAPNVKAAMCSCGVGLAEEGEVSCFAFSYTIQRSGLEERFMHQEAV
jgi:hypothetical protein